jgi:AcrR family transcriptional regulator
MASDKRKLFLTVGIELFGRYGYRDVSIEDVTRAAGVGTGSFYTYFPSKEAFYEEILDLLEKEGIAEVDRMLAALSSPLNKLKALYRFATLGMRRSPILRGFVTGDRKFLYPGRQERLQSRVTLRAHIETIIAGLLEEGSRKGELRSRLFRDPGGMALAIYDAVLLRLDSDGVEQLMDDVLLLLERGLKRRLRLRPVGARRDTRRALGGRRAREERRSAERKPRRQKGS